MSLPELIPSNLPQFVRLTPRSAFANSMIPQGYALCFAEPDGSGGAKFLYKNPDGSFSEVGGGSKKFYKCASVGTGTWSGYLASVDSTTGIWSFAETATTGLTYERITPQVGKVYDEGCTFMVSGYKTGLPTDGLVFYLALSHEIGDTDDTGTYPLNRDSADAFQFGTQNGIACAKGGSTGSDVGVSGATNLLPILPNASTTRYTASVWCAPLINADAGTCFGFTADFTNLRPLAAGNEVHAGNVLLNYNNGQTRIQNISNLGTMAFYHITYDGDKLRFYKNRSLLHASEASSAFGSNVSAVYPVVAQRGNWNSGHGTRGAFAAFRVYNRLLSDLELAALAAEFTPTAES